MAFQMTGLLRGQHINSMPAQSSTRWPWEMLIHVEADRLRHRASRDIEQSIALARQLGPMGVDLIDCSSGGTLPRVRIPIGPGYQTPFAERVRREAGVPTGAVGMITSPAQADHILRTGQADMVLLAREMLRN